MLRHITLTYIELCLLTAGYTLQTCKFIFEPVCNPKLINLMITALPISLALRSSSVTSVSLTMASSASCPPHLPAVSTAGRDTRVCMKTSKSTSRSPASYLALPYRGSTNTVTSLAVSHVLETTNVSGSVDLHVQRMSGGPTSWPEISRDSRAQDRPTRPPVDVAAVRAGER